jgi:hypothetical protein
MANFFNRLKLLPWGALFQSAALTTVILVAVEYLFFITLALLSSRFLEIGRFLNQLFSTPLFILIINFVTALGCGAFAVYLLERLFQRLAINAALLWALVLCLIICLLIKLQIPIEHLLVTNFSSIEMVGILLGVFQQGRRYWRW